MELRLRSLFFFRVKNILFNEKKTHFKEVLIIKNLIKKVFLGMVFAIPFYFSNLA